MPWTIRNYVVFHKFIPLRSNFGLELWLGNNPEVPDSWTWWLHPNDDLEEAHKYARMTEIPYMEEKQREAWAFIRSHPADIARFALHRFSNHWLGIWDSPADLWPTAPWYLKLTIIFSCVFALLSWLGTLLVYRARNALSPPAGHRHAGFSADLLFHAHFPALSVSHGSGHAGASGLCGCLCGLTRGTPDRTPKYLSSGPSRRKARSRTGRAHHCISINLSIATAHRPELLALWGKMCGSRERFG